MFKRIQSFIAVYETRSFSKAAEQLFISQPTVSVHIKQLELQLNTTLFERNGRTELVPTTNARKFYQHALHLLDDWQNATDSLDLAEERPRTTVRIGASQTSATVLLPKIFAQIKKDEFNTIDFKIEMHNSEEILAGVLNHQFDFGIIEKPITHDFITRNAIAGDQLVLAGNLDSTVWLVREKGSGVYHYTQQYFKQHNIVPDHFLTIANNDIIVKMLAQNVGKSIVSIQALPESVPYKKLDDAFNRQFYIIHHEHSNQSAIKNEIARFIQIARNL
ncbi:transcriptional regulator [Leuconostoc mesenteroides subsp. dextranicum]|jgi:DNA-binding transcriptional LysR family regulator|uniref:LysR family transcriptional regulator n=1 Tax=Leuconostoc TaxID=1243 RepID=UPI00068320F7|nr:MULTISPECIES: LysR family transcriptional regulator [Leuconostoc]KMY78359.1 transcriptional regulator [Leuconostoc mesenteroides subsp. mesenteroides]KMY81534.1 transcriptional regulator [Leuconostoc mesenteroides subsp. dextranicum]MBZ1503206.1 LysR family transcriptional regulator [Leuconostoc mesenteroides]MCH3979099.1 LysR family transcriptional regulator [Leuconostoc mesenteroides]MCI1688871.1 LysR family transcriptional regulator [Leuconostoc mesenteroides]